MSSKITLTELVESFISNTNKLERHSLISDIVKRINATSTILPLIVVLGKSLTSTTSSTSNLQRQDSILIIYETLKNCNNLQLKISELQTILTFLLSRFEHDLICQSFIILTVCALYQKYHNKLSSYNGSELVIQLFTTIISKLDYEKIKLKIKYNDEGTLNYNQLSRQELLKVFNVSLINHTNIILTQFDDLFMNGCIKLIDGESDPRNILLAFNLFQSLFEYYPNQILSKYAKELFEIMEVYFPIEFKAPKANKDVFGIQKQQLSDGLNESLGCHSLLSPMALTMILDKLEDDEVANDMQQMSDVLLCLKYCCKAYGIEIIQSYLNEIYDKLKSIILYGADQNIIDVAFDLLQCVVDLICNQKNERNVGYYNVAEQGKTVGDDVDIDNVDSFGWTTFLEPFINDFRVEIEIPDAKLARMSSKIIIQISNANFEAFCIVIKYLWNNILTKYEKTKENKQLISQKHALLEVMSFILMGLHAMNVTNDKSFNICRSLDVFLDVFITDTHDFNSKCIAMITLSYLCDTHSLLTNKQIEKIAIVIYKQFESILSGKNDNENGNEYGEIIYNCLQRISHRNATIVLDTFINNGITQYLDLQHNKNNINTLKICIDSIAPLCLQNNFIFYHLLSLIMDSLHLCLLQTIDTKEKHSLLCIKSCVKKINVILDYNDDFSDFDDVLIDTFLSGLIMHFPYNNLSKHNRHQNELFFLLNQMVSKFIAISSNQTQLKLAKYAINELNNSNNTDFNEYKLLIQLLCIACTDAVYAESDNNLLTFIINLQQYLLKNEENIGVKMMNYYFECVGCILNKCQSNSVINAYLNSNEFELVLRGIENANCLCLYYIIFVIKSLSIACYTDKESKKLQFLIEYLCKCLLSKNKRMGEIASFGFDIIINDKSHKSLSILNKKNKCKICSLYKQKFFIQTIKYIVSELQKNQNKNEENVNLLLAVCYLMKNVPNAVLTSHLSQLLPLIIESFKSSLDSLRISVLYLFEILFETNLDCIIPYIQTIIPILLQLTKYKRYKKVRISALKCLTLVTNLEYNVLHKMEKKVTKTLLDVVDDKKKDVRLMAVECRNKWFLLGQSLN